MGTGDNDDFAAGEALLRQLAVASDPVAQRETLDGVWASLYRLVERGLNEDALRLVDLLLAWQLDREREEAPDGGWTELVAYTMQERATALLNLGRLPESIAQCDDLLRRYGEAFENGPAGLRGYLAFALYLKGSDLISLGRWLEALAAFDDLVAKAPSVPEDERKWVAYARAERAEALEGLGDEAGAAQAYAEAIAALGNDDDPEISVVVQRTTVARGRLLAQLGRTDEAFAIFDALIAAPEPVASVAAAEAYLRKAYWLTERRHYEAAIATADAAVERFGSSDETHVRWNVACCMSEKIYALKALGRTDAAAFVADQLVDRFGADLDTNIEKIVAPYAHRLGRSRSRLRFPGLG
ncbi:MAG TPA: hypothetical protein VGI39_25525 [Polyangiaceae bacterium]